MTPCIDSLALRVVLEPVEHDGLRLGLGNVVLERVHELNACTCCTCCTCCHRTACVKKSGVESKDTNTSQTNTNKTTTNNSCCRSLAVSHRIPPIVDLPQIVGPCIGHALLHHAAADW